MMMTKTMVTITMTVTITMNKKLKKLLFFGTAVFGFCLLWPGWILAGAEINITPEPIFDMENIIPGDSDETTVSIKNNSGNDYESIVLDGKRVSPNGGIILLSNGLSNPDLAEVINLEVKRGTETKSINLAKLLNGDALVLPNGGIGNNQEKDFEFTATFDKKAGNEYQNKILVFDFIFTFHGEEVEDEVVTVRGAGGGLLPLSVYNERETEVGENSAVISWQTTQSAFARVIYDAETNKFDLGAGEPSYGYGFFTPKTETRATNHTITLTGLTPGTIYYYRVVAYASFAISREHSFTTLGEAPEPEPEPDPVPAPEPTPVPDPTPDPVVDPEPDPTPEPEPEDFLTQEECVAAGLYWYDDACHSEPEEVIEPEPEPDPEDPEEEPIGFVPNLLAAVGELFGDFWGQCFAYLNWLILLPFLLYAAIKGGNLLQKKKKGAVRWLVWAVLLLALTIYFFFAGIVPIWLVLMLLFATFLMEQWTSFNKKNRELIIGTIVFVVLLIVWVLIGCLHIWLILIGILAHFVAIEVMKKFFAKKETPKGPETSTHTRFYQ